MGRMMGAWGGKFHRHSNKDMSKGREDGLSKASRGLRRGLFGRHDKGK